MFFPYTGVYLRGAHGDDLGTRVSQRDVLLICIAGLAGIAAALPGGLIEHLLDWLFVGIPILLVIAGAIVSVVQRQRPRRR